MLILTQGQYSLQVKSPCSIVVGRIVIVGPQTLPTLLKTIDIRKYAYPNLLVHSPKHSQHSNTRKVDGHDQPSDLPTISPLMTPLWFKLVTSVLILLIGPQELPTLLKTIVVRKDVYPNLIPHSPKCSRHSNTRGVDGCGQSSDLPIQQIQSL